MPQSVVARGTSFWEEGAWSPYRGYPRAVSFYDQRLFLAGSNGDPEVIWGSRTSAYEDFEDGTTDSAALVYRISSGLADTIRWISSGRVLTAGSSAGEYAIAASNQNEGLTPSNFKANPQTSFGTSSCPPIRIGQTILYPQRNGAPANAAKKLREFAYEFASDAFSSVDITVFSEHILGDGVTRLAYQTEPDSIIWSVRLDGQMAACTYERKQEVVAWHRHSLGGINAQVNTIGVIPGLKSDELWMSVTRLLGDPDAVGQFATEAGDLLTTEDGTALITEESTTVRYIEVLSTPFKDDGEKDDAVFVDSSLSYSGPATLTLSGFWHLRGLDISINNNGSIETVTVSSTGRVTLSKETTKAHGGLTYTAKLQTEDMDAGAQAGTAQSRARRVSQAYVRLLNSLGGRIGSNASDHTAILYRTPAMAGGSSPDLFTGLKEIDMPGGWDKEKARIYIEHSEALPFHITGIVAELNTIG
jgi:hypothetical protein